MMENKYTANNITLENITNQSTEINPKQTQIQNRTKYVAKGNIFSTIFLGGYGNIVLDIIFTYINYLEMKMLRPNMNHKLVYLNKIDMNNTTCCWAKHKDHYQFGGHAIDHNHLGCYTIFDIYDLPYINVNFVDIMNQNTLIHIFQNVQINIYQQCLMSLVDNNKNIITHDAMWPPINFTKYLYKVYSFLNLKSNINNYIINNYKSILNKDYICIHLRFDQSTDNGGFDNNENIDTNRYIIYFKILSDYFHSGKIYIITNNFTRARQYINNLKLNESIYGRITYIENEPLYIHHILLTKCSLLCLGLSTFSISASFLNSNPFKIILYDQGIKNYYRNYNFFYLDKFPQSLCIENIVNKNEIYPTIIRYDNDCYEVIMKKFGTDSKEHKLLCILILPYNVKNGLFYRIATELLRQIKVNNLYDEVSILVNENKIKNIGLKRNMLINLIKSDYCSFIDNDCMIADNYLTSIVDAIKRSSGQVYVIGFNIQYFNAHNFKYIMVVSRDCQNFINKKKNSFQKIIYSKPNHLFPKKSSYHKNIPFKENEEDCDFLDTFNQLSPNEIYLDQDLYMYEFGCESTLFKRINDTIYSC